MKKKIEAERLTSEIIACKKCPLCKDRIQPVIGQGSLKSNIVFIGEAPGANEDKQGIPFCGRSGKVLDELLASVGIKREDIYICNVIKCRPPENRDPKEKEIALCSKYLDEQLRIISPKIICPLGRYSMKFIMEKFGLEEDIDTIGEIHGKAFGDKVKVVPFYHPAVALYNPSKKEVLKKDFKILKKYVN